MYYSNLSYRCYILPCIAAITYYILNIPYIVSMFNFWIPDYNYCNLVKSLILLIVLFITCRILDIIYCDMCHDSICTNSLDKMNEKGEKDEK